MTNAGRSYDIMEEVARLTPLIHPNPTFLAPNLTDTELVIVATSLVDKFLQLVLIAGFQKDVVSKRRLVQVFEGQGPLATFSAKIALSDLLGLTPPDVRHDLTILRKIRNSFAHSVQELELRSFPAALELKVTTSRQIEDTSEERRRFKQSCLGSVSQLCFTTLLRIAQYRFVTKHPEDVRQEYEAMLKEADVPEASSF